MATLNLGCQPSDLLDNTFPLFSIPQFVVLGYGGRGNLIDTSLLDLQRAATMVADTRLGQSFTDSSVLPVCPPCGHSDGKPCVR